MRLWEIVLAIVLIMLMSISALAFDGKRKGFILGAGLGGGITSYSLTIKDHFTSYDSDRENRLAFVTDLKIGYAPNEQLELYYTSKVSWFKEHDYYTDDVTISSGLGCVGFSYSTKLEIPTWFLSGGIGLASASMPFEDDAPDPMQGFGLYGGFGYEWSRHLSWELDLLYGKPKHDYSSWEITANGIAVKFTINALAY